MTCKTATVLGPSQSLPGRPYHAPCGMQRCCSPRGPTRAKCNAKPNIWGNKRKGVRGWTHFLQAPRWRLYPPPLCVSYADVHNYYGPYAYCSLDKGVACAQHIQLPTHTCAGHMC